MYAIGPAGIIHDTLPQASGRSLVTGSITHQISDKNTFSVRPNYQYESDENRGVGGVTLASAGTTFKHHEQQVTYTQQTILRPTLLNQFQMLFGHEREPTTSRIRRARHRRRRRVHGRRRTGRSGPHRNAHQAEREPGVDAWQASGPGRIPAARLEPSRFLRPEQLRRHVLLLEPRHLLSRAAVRVHPTAGERRPRVPRETGRHLHQGRLAGAAGPLDRLRPAL